MISSVDPICAALAGYALGISAFWVAEILKLRRETRKLRNARAAKDAASFRS